MTSLTLYIVLYSSLVAYSHHTAAQETPPKQLPPLEAYVVSYATPAIDGALNDDAWNKTPFTTDFIQHDTGAIPSTRTRAKLLYDDACLYLGLETEDVDIFTHFTRNGDPLFLRDDLTEIFIDPGSDGKNYIEIGVSASGHYYGMSIQEARNGRVMPKSIALKLATATAIKGSLNNAADKDSSWSVETCIPMSVIAENSKTSAAPNENANWSIGLYRIDYDHKTQKSKALGFYSWQYIGQFGFHRPERFGHVTFGKRPQ